MATLRKPTAPTAEAIDRFWEELRAELSAFHPRMATSGWGST